MCFGVRDAITLAKQHAAQAPLSILGDLVHNETVLNDLRGRGVRIVNLGDDLPTAQVMITAHGTSQRVVGAVVARGHRVIEATCPLVRHAHLAVAQLVREGHHPVIIGQRQHVEVRGITGDLEAYDVILTEADVDELRERPRFGVIAQTTQRLDRARFLVAMIQRRFPQSEVKFVDTVCRPTKQRQGAAMDLARQCTTVIVIGGAHSNNTRELVAACEQWCPRVHHVQTAQELRQEWFNQDDLVGITAGTSTPDEVIDAVEMQLHSWNHDAATPASVTANHHAVAVG